VINNQRFWSMASDVRQDMVALLPRLRRFAYSLCGSLDEADDLVQAACERALTRLAQFEPGTRLDSWMFRIVQTTWLDRMRSVRRRNTVNDSDALDGQSFDARIYEQVEARVALGIVRAEIGRLPEEQRVVLALVTVDGMTYQEAADVLEIPIGTVMSRLSRARRKLGEALERPQQGTPPADRTR
jgi:RNA polymerase sigma-70 factor, ECF subfamily